MDKKKKLQMATGLNVIAYVLLLVFGLVYSIAGTLMPYHEQFIGLTMEQIETFSPSLVQIIIVFFRLLGFAFISIAVLLIVINWLGFLKGEKWAWILIAVMIPLFEIPLLIVCGIVALFQLPFILTLINTGISIMGVALSAKIFLSK